VGGEGLVLADLVLELPLRAEVSRFTLSTPKKTWLHPAARHGQRNPGGNLPGRKIALHHECERDMLYLAQPLKTGEQFAPLRISRDVIVGEEAMGYACIVEAPADELHHLFGDSATAWFFPAH